MRVSSVPQRSARRSAKIAAFRQYQQLSRSFVTVNEKICQLRPVEDTLTPEEKNGRGHPAGGRPRNRPPADGHFGRLGQDGQRRLGSRRDAVGDCMHQVGAATLSHLLRLSGPRPATIACACGRQAHFHDTRPKQLFTVVGWIRWQRAYYVCSHKFPGR